MIADGAVGASGRTIELASDAPLHAHRNPIDVRVLVQRGPELVLTVLVRGSCKGTWDDECDHKFLGRNNSPLGMTPGSMKVASVKLAMTKKVMTPWYAGTHGKRSR